MCYSHPPGVCLYGPDYQPGVSRCPLGATHILGALIRTDVYERGELFRTFAPSFLFDTVMCRIVAKVYIHIVLKHRDLTLYLRCSPEVDWLTDWQETPRPLGVGCHCNHVLLTDARVPSGNYRRNARVSTYRHSAYNKWFVVASCLLWALCR
jgi:hypothetical protein